MDCYNRFLDNNGHKGDYSRIEIREFKPKFESIPGYYQNCYVSIEICMQSAVFRESFVDQAIMEMLKSY